MESKLRMLGLGIATVVALYAMAAPMAQAEEGTAGDFSAESYPADIYVVGDGTHVIDTDLGTVVCKTIETPADVTHWSIHGTGTLSEETHEITAEKLDYTNCNVTVLGLTLPVTVDLNGCSHVLHAGTYAKPESTPNGIAEGTVQIECPGSKEIAVTVFTSASHETLKCTVHIPPQVPEGTVTFHNIMTLGKMTITATVDNAKITATITDANTLGCNNHVHEAEGIYYGTFFMQARKDGKSIDLTTTGTKQ